MNALHWMHDAGRELLLSASDDKTICVWRTADWRCLKRLVAHQAGVLDVAPHVSGRLALSVARDRSLFMWNMVKGKVAFSVKTKECAACVVRWSPSGRYYLLAAGNVVTMSEVQGKERRMFAHEKEVLCAEFLEEGRIVTGGEDKTVRIWDERTQGESVVAMEHRSRVRNVAVVDTLLFSADSEGELKIWDVRAGGRPRLETSIGGGSMRLTCMAAAPVEKREVDVEESLKGNDREQEEEEEVEEIRSDKMKKREADVEKVLDGTASQRKRKKRKNAQKSQNTKAHVT